MIDQTVVELSRLQFALTAMYHFLFVPLTLGLSFMVAIMESVYVMTGKEIWRRMTLFWGVLFGINFAMGVATGIVMEFQFGMNWSYYSHYVGDIFGAPLAIEGLMAFFLEATFVGLFFFGWNRLSKVKHLMVTWLMALGTNLSAIWILVAVGLSFLNYVVRFFRTLGVPLVEAMRIAGEVLSNDFLRQELRDAARKVSEGGSLHRSLDQPGYFPPMMLHMIASGEASGELDSMLERTARMQENTLQSKIAAIVGLFEPMMLLVMGVVVLIIVLAIMLPILNMSNLVG